MRQERAAELATKLIDIISFEMGYQMDFSAYKTATHSVQHVKYYLKTLKLVLIICHQFLMKHDLPVSLIIPHAGSLRALKELIESLQMSRFSAEVLVVDGHPSYPALVTQENLYHVNVSIGYQHVDNAWNSKLIVIYT